MAEITPTPAIKEQITGADTKNQAMCKPWLKIIFISVVGLFLVGTLVLAGYKLGQRQIKTETASTSTPTPTIIAKPSPADEISGWKSYTFQSLKLNLKVPGDLIVHTEEPIPDNTFVAYIQNYPYNSPYPANAYQLYIIWQKTPRVTKEGFQLLKEDLLSNSISETIIDGYPAIKGQYKGERNRYATFIFKDSSIIALLTSDPTQTNKELTDQILLTFNFEKTITSPTPSPKLLNYTSDNCKISFSYFETFEFSSYENEKQWNAGCVAKNGWYPRLDLGLKSQRNKPIANDVQVQIIFPSKSGEGPALVDGLNIPIGQEVKIWPNDFLIKVSEVNLGGIRAVRLQGTGDKLLNPGFQQGGNYNISLARAIKNSTIYEIRSQFEQGTDETESKQYDDLFDLIISTFKFLD